MTKVCSTFYLLIFYLFHKSNVELSYNSIVIYYFFILTDTVALANSLGDLTCRSRQARTAMWCALKVTLLHKEDVYVETGTNSDSDENETESEVDAALDPDQQLDQFANVSG